MRIGIAFAGAALLATGAASCGGGSSTPKVEPTSTVSTVATTAPVAKPKPARLTVTPILVLKLGSEASPNYRSVGKKCGGVGGFGDLRKGRAVTIYDQTGSAVIGTAFIKQGLVEGKSCYMTAIVRDLPRLSFYKVQFANRNKIAFSEHDLIHNTSVVTIG